MRFPSASEPGGRDTYRSSDRYGADGAVRRSSCLRHRLMPLARQQSGAYRAWTGLFFFLVQPFSLLHVTGKTGLCGLDEAGQNPSRTRNLAGLYMPEVGLTSPQVTFFESGTGSIRPRPRVRSRVLPALPLPRPARPDAHASHPYRRSSRHCEPDHRRGSD